MPRPRPPRGCRQRRLARQPQRCCRLPRNPPQNTSRPSRLSGDGGYRGSDRIRTPQRGPDGRIIKDRKYRRFRKRRAIAEHTIARLKDHQILRQCRRRGEAINHAVAGVAALHNLKLDIR
ncbi:transposase family protein [Streptomyces sp. NPDC050743]|uniref:transposase family protein n=1 Tax=Streptomyces sp. NPDC050743 TaxID=3365634 RepID=UPI003797776B